MGNLDDRWPDPTQAQSVNPPAAPPRNPIGPPISVQFRSRTQLNWGDFHVVAFQAATAAQLYRAASP